MHLGGIPKFKIYLALVKKKTIYQILTVMLTFKLVLVKILTTNIN